MSEHVFIKPPWATDCCRHYSYVLGTNGGPACEGVPMGRDANTRACLSPPLDACRSRREWTEEERAAWKAWTTESLTRVGEVMSAIPGSCDRKDRATWGTGGEVVCPVCGGTVRWYRAARNGHIKAQCSTPNCFGVVQ